ncbi:MAG: hypothetical protein KC620_14935 [Myxococcales bacterium]|nr:hypothetical protein [Myxococcales bacterium]
MPLGVAARARAGLQAAEQRVAVAADRTARGLTIDAAAPTDSATRVSLSGAAPPVGDPVGDALLLKEGALAYRANLTVIKAADETLGQAIDLFG